MFKGQWLHVVKTLKSGDMFTNDHFPFTVGACYLCDHYTTVGMEDIVRYIHLLLSFYSLCNQVYLLFTMNMNQT